MPRFGFNGGLMGSRRVPGVTLASGVWNWDEQSVAKRAGIWPVPPGTYSQSSVYAGTTAISTALMTNGSFTDTGVATNNNAGDDWVKID